VRGKLKRGNREGEMKEGKKRGGNKRGMIKNSRKGELAFSSKIGGHGAMGLRAGDGGFGGQGAGGQRARGKVGA
jgi:hypothetical protein